MTGLRSGIVLLVVGAVLGLGVRDAAGVDLTATGWICAGAGALSLVLVPVLARLGAGTTAGAYVDRTDGVPPGA